MRHRTFTDRNGVSWTVSEITKTVPLFTESRERRAVPRSKNVRSMESKRLATRPHALPSLLFESRNERRRVTRFPDGWDQLPDEELEDLLGESDAIS